MQTTFRTLCARFKGPLAIALLLLLTASGLLTGWTERLTAPLAARNRAFLDASIKDTVHLMVPVGMAKAAADAVEGSTINIEAGAVFAKAGMTIEAGDTLQPILDYIDIAWKLLLISMIYLVTAKSVLTGAGAIAAPLLTVSLTAFLTDRLTAIRLPHTHAFRQAMSRVGALFLLCSLLFMLIIPLTVTGSAYLSRHTTEPLREDVRASFEQIGQAFSLQHFYDTPDLKEKAVILKEKLVQLSGYAQTAVTEVAVSVCKLAAIKLLNGIVYPLASFLFLVWLVRGCLTPALGLSATPLLHDDIHRLADWLGTNRTPPAKPSKPDGSESPTSPDEGPRP